MELKHYGVKGMKWGQNIMAQEYIPVAARYGMKKAQASNSNGKGLDIARRVKTSINNKINSIRPPKKVKVVGVSPSGKKQVVLPSNKVKKDKVVTEKSKTQNNSIDQEALKVIRGDYGNGEDRKRALGDNYSEIQSRVNELLKNGQSTTKKRNAKKQSIKKGGKEATRVERKTNREGIDTKNHSRGPIEEKEITRKENRSLKQDNRLTKDEKMFIESEVKKQHGKNNPHKMDSRSFDEYIKDLKKDKRYRKRMMANDRRRAEYAKQWNGRETK